MKYRYARIVTSEVVGNNQHEVETLDVLEAIKERRSIRAFKKLAISEKQIEKLVDAARHAPSAGNLQPWEFIIVKKTKIKEELARAALDQTFIEEAPVVVAVCADEARSGRGYGVRGMSLYCIQDTAAAIQNLLLAAQAMGLGACWVGAFREEPVRKILKTPPHVRPVALVPVGYPVEKSQLRGRRSLVEIIHRETF